VGIIGGVILRGKAAINTRYKNMPFLHIFHYKSHSEYSGMETISVHFRVMEIIYIF
jgi:hypothetical protein